MSAVDPSTDAHAGDLLERATTQWQFGDWAGLAAIDDDALRHHPQRARLAMLVAAAHHQLGRSAAARHHAASALAWGGSRTALLRLLVGNVHNTLGRAAAVGGESTRAAEHFRQAIAVAAPAEVARLTWPIRLGTQCAQLGLPLPADIAEAPKVAVRAQPATLAGALEDVVSAARTLRQRHDELQQRHEELTALGRRLQAELADWRGGIETLVKREVGNMTRQVQAHADVRQYLDGGALLPALHGWAISADFARYLLELFEARDYELIVEFGSGTSTVLLALALRRARQRGRKQVPRLLTFEHDAKYHAQTLAQLEASGVRDQASVVLAALQPYTAADGGRYAYYACQPALASAASALAAGRRRLLVIVDGPPAATGPHARYPALPVLLQHFPDARFDILLDDYKRRDEQEIVQMWLADFQALGFRAGLTRLPLEKKAGLLKAWKPAATPNPATRP